MGRLLIHHRFVVGILVFLLVDLLAYYLSDQTLITVAVLTIKDLVIVSVLYLIYEKCYQGEVDKVVEGLAAKYKANKIRLDQSISDSNITTFEPLTQSVNNFNVNLEQAVASVTESASRLIPMSDELAETFQNMTQKSALQSSYGESVSRAVQRMYDVSGQVQVNVTRINENISSACEMMDGSKAAVSETVHSIQNLAQQMTEATRELEELKQSSEQIGSIIDVINGIAEQTNLLALNAAIEAARAGEQGRGFAVVADEVRSLAQRTHVSTTEVKEMVEAIQRSTNKLANQIEESTQTSSNCVQQSESTQEQLNTIGDAVNDIEESAGLITEATEIQTSAAEEAKTAMAGMEELSSGSFDQSKLQNLSPQDLKKLGHALKQKIDSFILTEDYWDESRRIKPRSIHTLENGSTLQDKTSKG